MLKKILVIIIACIYLLSNSGAVINMHFCCGELVDWAVYCEAESCGGTESSSKAGFANSCCQDVHFFMLQNEGRLRSSTQQFSHALSFITAATIPPDFEPLVQSLEFQRAILYAHSPPLIGAEIFLQNRSFRL